MRKVFYIKKPSIFLNISIVLLVGVFIIGNIVTPHPEAEMFRLFLLSFALLFLIVKEGHKRGKKHPILTFIAFVLLGALTFYAGEINYFFLFLLCSFLIFKIMRKYEVLKFKVGDDELQKK